MKIFSSIICLCSLLALALLPTGCQHSVGLGEAMNQIHRVTPATENRTTLTAFIGPDGKTNRLSLEIVTNTYPSNVVGQVYLAEKQTTRKRIGTTYLIGGGNIQSFTTSSVNALGTVDQTSVGSYITDVNTNALKTVADMTSQIAGQVVSAVMHGGVPTPAVALPGAATPAAGTNNVPTVPTLPSK